MTPCGKLMIVGALLAVVSSAGDVCAGAAGKKGAALNRGRYLAVIAGCNDCHTAGYLLSEGKVPEKEWLTGDRLGWNGPWGTTYAPNLRLFMRDMSEDQWLKVAHTLKLRPPMPWYAVNQMTTRDLRAIYRLVRSLGPAGEPAPAYLPPGKTPEGPYIIFPQPPAR
jgi:mono/diheme cytochrome c family protein